MSHSIKVGEIFVRTAYPPRRFKYKVTGFGVKVTKTGDEKTSVVLQRVGSEPGRGKKQIEVYAERLEMDYKRTTID
jgi:hypothetical protein